jgi:hypothetical protein
MRSSALLLCVCGCFGAHYPSPFYSSSVSTGDAFRATAMPRAVFDLRCSAEDIDIHTLTRDQVGARGCGRRAVYLRGRDGQWHIEPSSDSALSAGDRGAGGL